MNYIKNHLTNFVSRTGIVLCAFGMLFGLVKSVNASYATTLISDNTVITGSYDDGYIGGPFVLTTTDNRTVKVRIPTVRSAGTLCAAEMKEGLFNLNKFTSTCEITVVKTSVTQTFISSLKGTKTGNIYVCLFGFDPDTGEDTGLDITVDQFKYTYN